MTEPKFTKGPWRVLKTSWENSLICAEDGTLIAICKIHADVTEDTQDECEKIKDLNADLLANAWQLPELRREIKELKAINKEMLDVLKACEELQGDVLMEVSTSQRIFNAMVEYNGKLNKALRKARGETE